MEADEQTALTRTDILHARAEASHEWSRLLGDTNSCALAKDGRSHPAAKFQEGRVAALGELARRTDDDTDAGNVAAEALAVTIRWVQQTLPGARQDRDWAAYRTGGIEAMTEISTVLETTD